MTIGALIVDIVAKTDKLTTGADAGVAALDKIERAAATADTATDRLNTTNQKLGATADILSAVGLPQWSSAMTTVAVAETEATVATTGLAAASSLLVTIFPALVAGAVLVGEAIVKLAQWYNDAQLAAETAAAKQDVINKAISEGAPKWITYGDAVKYVTQKFQEQQAQIPQVAAKRYNDHLQEMWEKQVQAALQAHALAEGLARVGTVLGDEGIGEKLKKQFEDGEKAIRKTREEHDKWLASVQNATIHMNLSTFALHRFGAVELPMVESSLKGVDTELDHLDSTTLPDFRTRLQDIGETGRHFTRNLTLIQDALKQLGEAFSPSSIFSSLIHAGMLSIFGPSGLIVDLAKKGLEALGKLVWDGLKKIGGYFKNLFGGPDADELAGRDLVAKFESNFASVNDMINQVGEAVRAAGGTSEQAQALIKAMWDAEKNGAAAAAEAIRRVQEALDGVHASQGDAFSVPGGGNINNDFPNLPTLPMASGGMGRTMGPTLFYSAGNEDFAFSGEGSRFGAGGGGGQEIHTHVYIDGREVAESVNRANDRTFQSTRKLRAA